MYGSVLSTRDRRDDSHHEMLRRIRRNAAVVAAVLTTAICGCQSEIPSQDAAARGEINKGADSIELSRSDETSDSKEPIALIVHADDAGLCHSVNAATIDALEKGLVTSASIMVVAPAFEEMASYAREHPDTDFGLHLTLNSEWDDPRWGPVAGTERVPSLVDPDGYFWRMPKETRRHANLRDIEAELCAQIDLAIASGIRISHLDTHMLALLRRPELLDVYSRLGTDYELPVAITLTTEGMPRQFTRKLRPAHAAAIERLLKAGLPVLDFIDHNSYGVEPPDKPAYYLASLRSLKPGTSQIVIHCGFADSELKAITDSADAP